MKTIRRILFAPAVLAIGLHILATNFAQAAITKVGNGDDGADLEVLSPITSGPIWESRWRAVETLSRLNVMGVPGLGQLIPELERTDLLMASQDAHPTGEQAGSIEVSGDKRLVYARTFAEPSAATRFFPASRQLIPEQLLALQIHEALHRALPADVRSNEDIVMHLTMAIMSPGASFDRIEHVASLYIHGPILAAPQLPTSSIRTSSQTQTLTLPPKSRTKFGYGFDTYGFNKFSVTGQEQFQGLDAVMSINGFKSVGNYLVEPIFRARLKFSTTANVGPSSFDLLGQVKLDEQTSVGPFVRLSFKSIDDQTAAPNQRDLFTVGISYRNDTDQTYLDSDFFYSPPSTAQSGDATISFKSVLSLVGHTGMKFGRLRVGGLAEVHASQGKDVTFGPDEYRIYNSGTEASPRDSFRILVVGPEFGYFTSRYQLKAYCKWIVNNTSAMLDDLGDVIDRGSGRAGLGVSLATEF